MGVFLYELRDKFDKKYIYVIFLCALAVVAMYHLFLVPPGDYYLQHFQLAQKSALIIFAGFIFISYELFADLQKKDLKELISVERSGMRKVIFCKDIMMLAMIGIAFVSVVVIELAFLQRAGQAFLIQNHVLRVLFLNYLLFPCMAANVGKMFALLCKRRWIGYLGILILILLGFAIFGKINMGLYLTMGINLDSIFKFFQFLQPNATWEVDYLYLVPAEGYRIYIFMFWFFLAETLLFIGFYKKKCIRGLGAIVCLVVTIFMAYQVLTSNSYLNYDLNETSAANKQSEFEDDIPLEEKLAEFLVDSYVMDLRISDALSAIVEMAVDKPSLDEYHFTLYRGYEIDSITDESGMPLEYHRQQDYITIYGDGSVSEIYMTYHGFSHTFYSNAQGVLLPGYFAYYPQAGHRAVFLDETVDGYIDDGFNTSEELLSSSDFEIRIDYAATVCSNLEEKNGVFVGTTKIPTIIAGLVEKETRDDCDIVYPSLVTPEHILVSELVSELQKYCDILGVDSVPYSRIQHVVVIPNTATIGTTAGNCFVVEDTLFVGQSICYGGHSIEDLAFTILNEEIVVTGEKTLLFASVMAFLENAMYVEDLEPMNKEEFFDVSYTLDEIEEPEYVESFVGFGCDRMYGLLVDTFGEEVVAPKTITYLQDSSDTRTAAAFMQDLYRELEGEE